MFVITRFSFPVRNGHETPLLGRVTGPVVRICGDGACAAARRRVSDGPLPAGPRGRE